jgi:protein-S-isoprenylcysteine O-methyltransferase Ste14
MSSPAGAPKAVRPELARDADLDETSGVRVPPPALLRRRLRGRGHPRDGGSDRWPPLAVTILIPAIGIAGWLALDGAAMLSFSRAGTSMIPVRPSAALVTTGPYRFTRNPVYLGMAFLYLAFAIGLGPLIALPVVLATVDRLVIAREEAYLVRRFGQPYRACLEETRRWV